MLKQHWPIKFLLSLALRPRRPVRNCGTTKRMAWRSYNVLMDTPRILVLDARPVSLYSAAHIRGSVCVSLSNDSRTLCSSAGPGPPTWHPNCWWDRHVLLVLPSAPSRKRRAAGNDRIYNDSSSHPVYKFLKEEELVRSLKILQADEGEDDAFICFARRYPFLITKSVKTCELKNYPSEIVPGLLYLGDIYHAKDIKCLEDLCISHVLTIHTEPLKLSKSFVQLFLELEDSAQADIKQYFEPMFEFVDSAKNAHKRVLVHCGAGASRSATLCAAYLMRTKNWPVETSLEFLKEQRSKVNPNPGFLYVLRQYSCALGYDETGKLRFKQSKSSDIDPQVLWHLDVMKDGKCIGNISLNKEKIIFGRGLDCHVTLDHASISRQHAFLTRASDLSFQLVDNSTHGTFINGVSLSKTSPTSVKIGDTIKFGASSRKYVCCNKTTCTIASSSASE